MDESVAVVEDGADDDEQEGADDEPSERLDLGQDDHKDELDRVHQRVEAVLDICRKKTVVTFFVVLACHELVLDGFDQHIQAFHTLRTAVD